MAESQPALRAVFCEALDRKSPQEQAAYLDQACQGMPELRAQVEALLRANAEASGFLEGPPDDAMTGETPPAIEALGRVIGPYKLLEQIGEGGFGIVFMAEQQQPIRRRVALKVLKPGMDTRQVIARFEAERQALALMDHPHIAHVFDAGETASGRPYFVMELVRGVPITDYCDQNNLTPRERLELFVSVCQAVQHAHQKGIIHRDIKPSNVLVTLHDGTPMVKIIDFGIAKATGQRLTEKTLFTNFVQMIGTPLYMSPEQAEMSGLDVDTRTDIYSLGVLLYELLTGTTPFGKERLRTAAYDEIRRIIREEEPPRPSKRISTLGATLTAVSAHRKTDPRQLRRLVRGELDWIVMKALEKDRRRRYESASAFAADVLRYLHDEPVQACPPSAAYRFRKFARRNKVALATAAVIALALVLGTVVSVWQAIRATGAEGLAEERRHQAENDRELARQSERHALQGLYEAKRAQAKASRWSGRVGQRFDSLQALTEAAQLARQLGLGQESLRELRNEAIACMALADVRGGQEWEGNPTGRDDGFALDAKLERYARIEVDGSISVRRLADNAELARFAGPSKAVRIYWFSPDGTLLTAWHATPTAGRPEPLVVWDWQRGAIVFQSEFGDFTYGFFTPDSRQVVVGRHDGTLRFYELASRKEVKRLAVGFPAHALAFHPDGSLLAVGSEKSSEVHVRDSSTGGLVCKLPHPGAAARVAWHPHGVLLAVASENKIYLWDTATWRIYKVLQGHQGPVRHVAFADEGDVLLSYSWDGKGSHLWEPWTGRLLLVVPCSARKQPSWDERGLIGGGEGRQKPQLWEVALGREYRAVRGPVLTGLHSASVSPDGRWVAAAHEDAVRLWDLARGAVAAYLPVRGPIGVMFHPSGKELITSGSADLYRWPLRQDGDRLRIGPPSRLPMPASAGSLQRVAFDAAGRTLAVACGNGGVVLDLEAAASRAGPGSPDPVLLPHAGAVFVSLSPDGLWVATGTWNGSSVKVWDAPTGQPACDPFLRNEPIAAVAFSLDGRWLMAGTPSAGVDFLQVRSWQPGRHIPPDDMSWISAQSFSPDGKLMVGRLGGDSSVIQLLDYATGRPVARLQGPHTDPITWFGFTPDSAGLVVAAAGQLRVWDLRRIRTQLAAMGLDWDLPPYPPVNALPPLRVEVALGERTKSVSPTRSQAEKARTQIARYRDAHAQKPDDAQVCNSLAWVYVTAPAPLRDPQAALALAEKAVQMAPQSPDYRNTLGAAYYRAGRYREAVDILRSNLQNQEDRSLAFDLFFLAMSHQRLGEGLRARDYYDWGVRWTRAQQSLTPKHAEQLEQLRAEAAGVLGVKE